MVEPKPQIAKTTSYAGKPPPSVMSKIRQRGNQYVDQNIRRDLLNPQTRTQYFSQLAGPQAGAQLPQHRPAAPEAPDIIDKSLQFFGSPLGYENPAIKEWGRYHYIRDPQSQDYVKQRAMQQFQDPEFVEKFFGSKMNTMPAIGRFLGPVGLGGAAGVGLGLATKNPLIAMAGLATTGGAAYNQYRQLKDPKTWARAFGSKGLQDLDLQRRLHAGATLYSRYGDSLGMFDRPKQAQATDPDIFNTTDYNPALDWVRRRQQLRQVEETANQVPDIQKQPEVQSLKGLPKLGFWPGNQSDPYGTGVEDTDLGQATYNANVNDLLNQHTGIRSAKRNILSASNLSTHERYQLLNAVDQAAATEGQGSDSGLLSMKNLLPALAGAGAGRMGASMMAPVFGLSEPTKKMFDIGSSALGAILNVDWGASDDH